MTDSEREKRSPGDYIPLHEDTQQFISRGPILAYIKDDTGQGEFTVNSIFLDIGTIFTNQNATWKRPSLKCYRNANSDVRKLDIWE